jgi:hypothetical protein
MRRLIALSTMAALAAVAAPAAAQDQSVPPPTTPPPAPAPPPPAAGQMTVVVDHVGKFATTLTGKRFRVRGDVVPYVAGQHVVVRFSRDGKKFLAKRAAVKPGASGRAGHFKVSLSTKVSGKVTVRVTKEATATQAAIKAPAMQVMVLPDHVTPGTTGNAVRIMQRQLRALGYAAAAPTTRARPARCWLSARSQDSRARRSPTARSSAAWPTAAGVSRSATRATASTSRPTCRGRSSR